MSLGINPLEEMPANSLSQENSAGEVTLPSSLSATRQTSISSVVINEGNTLHSTFKSKRLFQETEPAASA